MRRRQVRGQQSPTGKSVITRTNCSSKLLPLPWSLWEGFVLYMFTTKHNCLQNKRNLPCLLVTVLSIAELHLHNAFHPPVQKYKVSSSLIFPSSSFTLDALNLQKWKEDVIRLAVQTFKRTGLTESRRTERCWRNSQSNTEHVGIHKFYWIRCARHSGMLTFTHNQKKLKHFI